MTILKLDFDGMSLLEVMKSFQRDRRLLRMMRTHKISKCEIKLYKTRRGFHVYVNVFKKMSDHSVVFWQVVLGSDVEREIFNLQRILKRIPNWNVLFNTKWVNGKKVSEEKYCETIIVSCPRVIKK